MRDVDVSKRFQQSYELFSLLKILYGHQDVDHRLGRETWNGGASHMLDVQGEGTYDTQDSCRLRTEIVHPFWVVVADYDVARIGHIRISVSAKVDRYLELRTTGLKPALTIGTSASLAH
jgi:hypothetical protein